MKTLPKKEHKLHWLLAALLLTSCGQRVEPCAPITEQGLDAIVSSIVTWAPPWSDVFDEDANAYEIVYAEMEARLFVRLNSDEIAVLKTDGSWPPLAEYFSCCRHDTGGVGGLLGGVEQYVEFELAKKEIEAQGGPVTMSGIDERISERRKDGRARLASNLPSVCSFSLDQRQVAARSPRLSGDPLDELASQIISLLKEELAIYDWTFASIEAVRIAPPTKLQSAVRGAFRSAESTASKRSFYVLTDLRRRPKARDLRIEDRDVVSDDYFDGLELELALGQR